METYIDVYVNTDGVNISDIYNKLLKMGLKPAVGNHDFVHEWDGIVSIGQVIEFADRIQTELRGSGAFLKFTSAR